jgi:hypothetical protein
MYKVDLTFILVTYAFSLEGGGGCAAIYSNDFTIAAGIGGEVGRKSPVGWYPLSSAVYVKLYVLPSSP